MHAFEDPQDDFSMIDHKFYNELCLNRSDSCVLLGQCVAAILHMYKSSYSYHIHHHFDSIILKPSIGKSNSNPIFLVLTSIFGNRFFGFLSFWHFGRVFGRCKKSIEGSLQNVTSAKKPIAFSYS